MFKFYLFFLLIFQQNNLKWFFWTHLIVLFSFITYGFFYSQLLTWLFCFWESSYPLKFNFINLVVPFLVQFFPSFGFLVFIYYTYSIFFFKYVHFQYFALLSFFFYNLNNTQINHSFCFLKIPLQFFDRNFINYLVFWHPIILLFILVFILFFYFFKNTIKVSSHFLTYYFNFFFYILQYFILLTFILGSWWAAQELNWGLWWNWDVVELNLLQLVIWLTFFSHFFWLFFWIDFLLLLFFRFF